MYNSKEIKDILFTHGADLCGIANIARFKNAPDGFTPTDIYNKTKSVLVFAQKLPAGTINAKSCIPYTHINDLIMRAVDQMTFKISCHLDNLGIENVIIPTDDPYEYWDAEKTTGKAILSLRHAAWLAGLGKLGKNTLLINDQYGNMIQIGAILLPIELAPDPMAEYEVCPEECDLCIEDCPVSALDGNTVDQKLCRPVSNSKNEKGYYLKKCYKCRSACPNFAGIN